MSEQTTPTTQPSNGAAPPPPPAASAIPMTAPPTPSVIPTNGAPKASPENGAPSAVSPENAVPEDWRAKLPAELKNETSLGPINSVEDLAKSYIHAQKVLGGPKISIPDPKLATPEDYRNVFKKLGLPEKQEDYKIEAAKDAGLDPEFLKNFQENAFKAGVLPKQAQELLNWYTEASKGMLSTIETRQKEAFAKEHQDLRTEWGKAYDKNLLAAQLVVKDFGDDSSLKFIKESGLHQNPQFLRFLSKIGQTIKEPELKGSAGRGTAMKTPAEAMSEATRIMGDASHPYNNAQHPSHSIAVKEVATLFDMANPQETEQ